MHQKDQQRYAATIILWCSAGHQSYIKQLIQLRGSEISQGLLMCELNCRSAGSHVFIQARL